MTKLVTISLITLTGMLGSCITVTPTPSDMAKAQTSAIIRKVIPHKQDKPRIVIPAVQKSQHTPAIQIACDAVSADSQGRKRIIVVIEDSDQPLIMDCPAAAPRSIQVSTESPQTLPAPAAKAHSSSNLHIVRSGDNLWQISKAHCVNLEALMKANSLTTRSILQPGQRLTLPRQSCT